MKDMHEAPFPNTVDKDVFPRAYHTLVHCPIEAMYNTLLGLEQDYAMVIQERYIACRKEQADIEERYLYALGYHGDWYSTSYK